MKYNSDNHTFAICAYKKSKYLEECILSLKNQSVNSNIIISTSTPNDHIYTLAAKYKIPVVVNNGALGIANDWNFAYNACKTELITIAHQDDTYNKDYVKQMLENINECRTPLVFFTNYGEVRNGETIQSNKLLRIKRIMLLPMRVKNFRNVKFIRRAILSFGCPICCPSVTFVKGNLPYPIFEEGYRSDVDWQAWEKLSIKDGGFIYSPEILTYHRVHEESATTAIIGDNIRSKEDFDMFCKFWPKFIAKMLVKFYSSSEKSNKIN